MDKPKILLDPQVFVNDIIIPNKNLSPILRDMTVSELRLYSDKVLSTLEKIKGNPSKYITKMDEIYNDLMKPLSKDSQ